MHMELTSKRDLWIYSNYYRANMADMFEKNLKTFRDYNVGDILKVCQKFQASILHLKT
jgi:hypothetical protein